MFKDTLENPAQDVPKTFFKDTFYKEENISLYFSFLINPDQQINFSAMVDFISRLF